MVVMQIGSKQKPNYKTSMCIAAFTTNHARIKLYNLMDKIVKSSDVKLYYCDTDSVIFEGADTIETGDLLGELTSELEPEEFISRFASTGAKAYGYETSEGNTSLKMKGVHEIKFNFDDLYNLATNKIEKISGQPTMTFKKDKLHNVYTVHGEKEIQNTLDKRMWNQNGTSVPHGWEENHY
jgi:hypothetical protein